MIITCATDNYSHYINLLFKSYRKSNPNKPAKCFCIGWDQSKLKDYRSKYPEYEFIYRWIPLKSRNNIGKAVRDGAILKIKTQLIEESWYNTSKFLWIDADSIILKDISPILEKLDKYDFICTYRPRQKENAKFLASVMGFSSRSERFINDFSNYIEEKELKWFYDQLALWYSYTKNKKEIKLYALSNDEHSIHQNEDAIILDRRKNMPLERMIELVENIHLV